MPDVSKRRLEFLWRVLDRETHCRLQSYSLVMNEQESSDYGEALQTLWIIEDALGRPRDTTWPHSLGIKRIIQ